MNLKRIGDSVSAVGSADGSGDGNSVSAGERTVEGEAAFCAAGEGVDMLKGGGISGAVVDKGAGVYIGP